MGRHEQRRDHRYPARIPALLVHGGRAGEVTVQDVSFRGAFVTGDWAPRVRELVRLRLVLPSDGSQFIVQAAAVRVTPAGDDGKVGIGLQFFALTAEQDNAWNRVVAGAREAAKQEGARPFEGETPARRRFQRFAMIMQVRLHSCGQIHDLFSHDLSVGGVFLETHLPLPLGEPVVVQLVHPVTLQPFDLQGEVRRRVKDGPVRGVAVEFAGLTVARRSELMDFISGARPSVETPIEVEAAQ